MTDNAPAVQPLTTWTPGFYDDGHGLRRWWDGRTWTSDLDPAHIADETARHAALQTRVAEAVRRGWSVEYATPDTVVLAKRIPMAVLSHILGVILTGGLWLIYVIIRASSPRYHRVTLTVDEHGRVHDR